MPLPHCVFAKEKKNIGTWVLDSCCAHRCIFRFSFHFVLPKSAMMHIEPGNILSHDAANVSPDAGFGVPSCGKLRPVVHGVVRMIGCIKPSA